MFWKYPTSNVTVDIEFLAHEKELLTVSRTIQPDGVMPDDAGEKWVKKGSFIDKDGKVTVPTITEDDITFEEPPIGILFSAVKVTYGPDAGAVMIKGWVKGDYMDWGEQEWKPVYGEKIHKLLPGINFKDNAGTIIYGPPDPATKDEIKFPEPEEEEEAGAPTDPTEAPASATITGDKNQGFTITYKNLGEETAEVKVIRDNDSHEMERTTYWTMSGNNPYVVKIQPALEDGDYTLKALLSGKEDVLASEKFNIAKGA